MITAKTNDGFEIELSEDALDDAELLDALGGMQDGNVFDMSRLTQVLWWLHSDTSKPPSVLADLCGEADTSNVQCYASAEEFDAALAALKGG